MIGGAILGLGALVVMAAAPSVPVLALGWLFAQLGWGTAAGTFLFIQADRVPESQRGSVAGLMGFAQMAAPVLGSVIGAALVFSNYLVFLVPGGIGFALIVLFALTAARENPRAVEPAGERLTFAAVLPNYVFNPRLHPDFGWNWLGRFLFMFGLTLNTTFTIFFVAQKAGTDIAGIAGLIALVSLGGVGAAALGALGGGWLSDRIKRRKIFILIAGVIFAVAATVMAFAPDLTTVVIAGLGTQLAIGIFSSIDNAILLDIMPNREAEAGRYSGISQIAISLAQALAPLAAAAILLIGVTGTDKNYTLLFLVAAVVTLLGALSISTRVKGSR
jgi:MFS family permease